MSSILLIGKILGSKQIRQTQDNTGKCYEVGFVGTKMPGICRGCKNDEKRKCYPFSRSPVFSLSLCHIVEDRAWLAAWVACQGRPCVLQLGETQLKLDRTLKGAGSLVPTRNSARWTPRSQMLLVSALQSCKISCKIRPCRTLHPPVPTALHGQSHYSWAIMVGRGMEYRGSINRLSPSLAHPQAARPATNCQKQKRRPCFKHKLLLPESSVHF